MGPEGRWRGRQGWSPGWAGQDGRALRARSMGEPHVHPGPAASCLPECFTPSLSILPRMRMGLSSRGGRRGPLVTGNTRPGAGL